MAGGSDILETSIMKEVIKESGAKAAGSQKVRFGLVGVINTAVDFAVLNLLAGVFGLPLFLSNIGSTTVAMLTSFGLNKKAVFPGSSNSGRRQFILFIVVTLIGVWGVQGGVLALVHYLLQPTGWQEPVIRNLAKLAGICVGLVWNYLMYSRVVFRGANS
jgi:putative flippase GtrA